MAKKTVAHNQEIGQEADIAAKLDTLIRLFALLAAPEELSLTERAIRLHGAGLAPKEIGQICGTSPHNVSVLISDAKRKAKKTKKATK